MIHIHSSVWGGMISGFISQEGYEVTLPVWSGRQTDVSQIDALIRFLQTVKSAATPSDWLAPKDEPRPRVSSPSLMAQTVSEILAEEGCVGVDGIQDFGLEGVQGQEIEKVDLSWLTPATDEDLAGQSSDSRDLEDFFDEDDDEDYYPY